MRALHFRLQVENGNIVSSPHIPLRAYTRVFTLLEQEMSKSDASESDGEDTPRPTASVQADGSSRAVNGVV